MVSDTDKIAAVVEQFPGVMDADLRDGYRAWLTAYDAPAHVRRAVLDAARVELDRRGLATP